MSESRAADSRAAVRRGPRGAFAVPFRLALALLVLGWVAAQPAPTLTLGSYAYVVGETLELAAANLEPGASYRVELTPPGEGDTRPAPLVSVLEAAPDGTLLFTAPLQRGGTYSVSVAGPRLDATLNVRVSGAEEAVGQVGTPGEGGEGEAGAGETPDATEAPGEGAAPADAGATEGPEGGDETAPDTAEPGTEADADGAAGPGDDQAAGAPDGPGASQPGAAPDTEADQAPGADDAEPGTGAEDDATGAPGADTGPTGPTPPDVGTPDGATGERPSGPTGPAGQLDVRIAGGLVVAERPDGTPAWRLDFPAGSGRTEGLARAGDRLVVGHGNHLLDLDPATGRVLARHRLPAQVVDVSFTGTVAVATVRYANGVERRVRVLTSGPERLEAFDPYPEMYGWLREEANVADPLARLEVDPTNPWLYLAVVERAPVAAQAASVDDLLEQALTNSATFYERAQLADAFLSLATPRQDLAGMAMRGALEDFAARGYRAELLTDERLAEAYGFPLGRLVEALGRGNVERAGFWAEWLYRTSSPATPATQAALREYARYLQEAGQNDAASLWRTRANEGGRFDVRAALSQAALTVGRTGWYGVAALLVSVLALHVTLLAKYWRPQSLTLRRQRDAGRQVSPGLARLTFMRYATFMERLVVVLLFAAALALTALQGWARSMDEVPEAWGSGSLATPVALDAVVMLDLDRPDALFVRGYAAQTAGDEGAAREAYSQLPDDPAALNNLAVLTGDETLLQRALELDGGQPEALYNLGRAPNPSRLLAEFAEGEPVLAVPSVERLGGALAGTYLGALAGAFTNPWVALTEVDGVAMPDWAWTVLVVVLLAWAALSVLVMFVPRPRLARNAPRTLLYHLLALLLPGTGLADEFWGVFLMVPWAIFGVDFLLNYLPGGPDATMALRTDSIALIVIYVINLVAFLVELASYRRRMTALKQNDPQTARDYGMRVPAPELG